MWRAGRVSTSSPPGIVPSVTFVSPLHGFDAPVSLPSPIAPPAPAVISAATSAAMSAGTGTARGSGGVVEGGSRRVTVTASVPEVGLATLTIGGAEGPTLPHLPKFPQRWVAGGTGGGSGSASGSLSGTVRGSAATSRRARSPGASASVESGGVFLGGLSLASLAPHDASLLSTLITVGSLAGSAELAHSP